MNSKRTTIYDIAKELGISGSYVSKALNNHPAINDLMKKTVKEKANQLRYKQNSHAANLRSGSSKTIGVIVPKIGINLFSQAISGMEEACFENHHSLIICQSDDLLNKEILAVDTLIRHNVDCIIVSISAETKTSGHLEQIRNHHIPLIQFDRYLPGLKSSKVCNDNKEVSIDVVKHLWNEGYNRIAFIGGPEHLAIYKERKDGFIAGIKETQISIPYNFIIDNIQSTEDDGATIAAELLQLSEPPDAIFTISDFTALGVSKVANSMNIKVPQQLGIFGFCNEPFTKLIQPALSTVDQQSKELGRSAANLYFNSLAGKEEVYTLEEQIIASKLIMRQSSSKRLNA